MRDSKKFNYGMLLVLGFFMLMACESLNNPFLDDLPEATTENRSPDTHLFLEFAPDHIDTVLSDTTADTTFIVTRFLPDTSTSNQILYWWGEDPDGEVIAYQYRWNFEADWTTTTSETDTFLLPIKVIYDEFVFQVRAIDNDSLADPSPATLRFPITNSLPEIQFAQNSNPLVGSDPNVTHVTFPTRTFAWTMTDPDGAETISRVRYALDDTTNWHYLGGDVTSIKLTGIDAGYHTFFVQALDTAGAPSALLQFPDSTDNTTPNFWRVEEPQGEILIIDDYLNDNGSAHQFYTGLIDSIYGPNNYTLFVIGENEKALPLSQSDQAAMFGYFKTVFWYHFTQTPRLAIANLALRTYMENGGNIFVTTLYVNPGFAFTSIDSSFKFTTNDFLLGGFQVEVVNPMLSNPGYVLPDTLATKRTQTIPYPLFAYYPRTALEPGESVIDLFRLTDPSTDGLQSWTGHPSVGILYRPSPTAGQSVYFCLPLHLFVGNNNVVPLMDFILNEIFE
ncbi:MAG: hypothetical protein K9M55_09425 [Candidatus Marinimicrobia bacterium]|nr:hypothetical protein [Candidatus Neomarinimicrobiota bacterium]MCF7922906.1 hypothetical protein [Candidatus Neomarinimicrobiota bacterium]